MASMALRGDGLAVVDRWTAELHERVAETVNSVCGAFKQELEVAAQPTVGQVDYDTYNDCCQRLVQYIAANMDTSPYFTQQMDRIILACHSSTSEQVLGSLVTKDVWLRPREKTRGDEGPTVRTGQDAGLNPAPMVADNPNDPVVKTEGIVVNASPSDNLPGQVETGKTVGSSSRRSVLSTHQDVEVAKAPSPSALGRNQRKRPSGRRAIMTKVPPAKRQRKEEESSAIEIWSTADEDDGDVSDGENLFGTETETDEEEEEEGEMNGHVEIEDPHQERQCEYSIQVKLRESMHQVEHQRERIDNVQNELDERKKELVNVNASRLTNPPSRISFLTKQVNLLERELKSEQEQLTFYQCLERGNIEAAEEAGIDTVTGYAGFQTHYVVKNWTEGVSAANEVRLKAVQVAPASQAVTENDELLPSLDGAIGKLCYAGQRSQEQTKMFKERLRKSITFIDALLCKPPQGKMCVRDCKEIRRNRCTKDVPCDNEMCGNWHHAEAHTDNCLNPQCEFKLRIILREIMHGIKTKQRIVQEERAKVQIKTSALEIIQRDEKSAKHHAASFSLVDTRQQDRFFEAQVLQDEIDQLKGGLAKEEQLLHDLNEKRKELKEKLYTIGIDESDDIIYGFPEFTTHYENKRGSRKQRAH
ncbi:hypothetical protein PF002_g424 [Phytophthora fragariae]|nr:hypothetical protein PF009_g738 [Phytophthora fragariae]KAE9030877.1 hypothetical protein PF011_g389 [Phytophthora fragariae]KAE9155608.1 hypothetical protein PF006_g424 [Phytophthora fragariae]KAE9258049.1 hypothetical protein PF002_g424 [Phytophthora fragariae]KAE9330179.1 hypothetical protein PF001_g513 [Phytophthora fragariae]